MHIIFLSLLSVVLVLLSGCASASSVISANENRDGAAVQEPSEDVVTYLSGATYVTNDLQASLDFYKSYLGFREGRTRTLDDDSSRAIFGLEDGATVLYATLLPTNFSSERRDFTTLNFAEVRSAHSSPFKNSDSRKAIYGEPVMAFSVTQLENIESRMRANGIIVIDALKLSPTGRSMTLTVLDPNGVRIQLYEIMKQPEIEQ